MSQHSYLIYHYLDSARIEHELDGIACSAKILSKCRTRAFGRSTSAHTETIAIGSEGSDMCKKGSSHLALSEDHISPTGMRQLRPPILQPTEC